MNDLSHAIHSHVMGGSTAAQRRYCPGSLKQEEGIPEPPESEYASRGSMLHAGMDLLITEDPDNMRECEALFEQLIGQDMGYPGNEITQELIDTKIRPAMQAWFKIRKKYGFVDWFREQRVSLERVIPGAFGTADIIAIDKKGRLHILDWKFGDGIQVDVRANDGTAFYAAAALYEDDEEMLEFTKDVKSLVFHIVQPRVGSDTVFESWETNLDWVEAWIDQSIDAMELAQSDDPPLKSGDWCKFCKARATCPALNALASEALSMKPESMDATSLSDALTKANQLKSWIKSVFELAQQEMEGGAAVSGWKLVNKLPRRQWLDEAEAEKRLRRARLRVDNLFKRSLITPTQLEKLKPRLYSQMEDDYVILHSSGLTVVPDSDRRTAVTSSMELLANALPDEKRKRNTS